MAKTITLRIDNEMEEILKNERLLKNLMQGKADIARGDYRVVK